MKLISHINARLTYCIFTGIILFCSMNACVDDGNTGTYTTFDGEMIGQYISKDTAYSDFSYILNKTGLLKLLNAYGTYTCFLPDNKAVQTYIKSLGYTSLEQLSMGLLDTIAYSHLVKKEYKYASLSNGSAILNMNNRYLTISISGTEMYINTRSKVTTMNVELENGIVHKIDALISPSSMLLADLIGANSDLSLFHEALTLTGMADSLGLIEDESYPEKAAAHVDNKIQPASQRKYGYTAFVETNEVYAAAGITTIEQLKLYAASVYDVMFPGDASVVDPTDRRNSLNRFVSYHLADKRIDYSKFIFNYNYVSGYDVPEYIQTDADILLEVSYSSSSDLMLNKNTVNAVETGILVYPPVTGGTDNSAINGAYHLIDKVLVYDEYVRDKVLNKRLRFDSSSLLGELSSNDLRGTPYLWVSFPSDYFENLSASDDSKLRYLGPNPAWMNLQGDEFMVVGPYDFTVKLPKVPAGNYEIRLGFNANKSRGIAQIYFGSASNGLSPVGIPLSMIQNESSPLTNTFGNIPDASTTDNGYSNDKSMRNKGWMKAPDCFYRISDKVNARQFPLCIRRVITTADLLEGETYYLRFKSVTDEDNREFHFDYLEMVPKSVYANPDGEDRH